MLKRALLTSGLAAAVLAADQWTKDWVLQTLSHGRTVEVLPSCFHLIFAENRSAAFGVLHFVPEELRRTLLTGLALIASVVLVGLSITGRIQRTWTAAAAGLIAGGAAGNAIDRIRHGFVVDFIDWHIGTVFHWNTFNVADSGIVVGVGILLWLSYWVDRKAAAAAPKPAAAR